VPGRLQRLPNLRIQLLARLIVRRHDERLVWMCGVRHGDGLSPIVTIGDLMNATLLVKARQGIAHLGDGEMFDDTLQVRMILLTLDVVEAGDGDIGSLRWSIEPHAFVHATADQVFMFSVVPVSPRETHIVSKWLVHKDAVEGVDYNPDHLAKLWRTTNDQDGRFSSLNHQGIATDGYRPGRYAVEEKLVEDFKQFYVDRSRAALEGLVG